MFWARKDKRKYRSKRVEEPRDNKLSYTVASCWSFSYIIWLCLSCPTKLLVRLSSHIFPVKKRFLSAKSPNYKDSSSENRREKMYKIRNTKQPVADSVITVGYVLQNYLKPGIWRKRRGVLSPGLCVCSRTMPGLGCISCWRFLPFLTFVAKRKLKSVLEICYFMHRVLKYNCEAVKSGPAGTCERLRLQLADVSWECLPKRPCGLVVDIFRPEQFTNSFDLDNPQFGLHLH
jgi:hypothetical protein